MDVFEPRAEAHAGHPASRPLRAAGQGVRVWLEGAWAGLAQAFRDALQQEVDGRRLFLWLPVAFGAGVLLYFAADREPTLWAPVVVRIRSPSARRVRCRLN